MNFSSLIRITSGIVLIFLIFSVYHSASASLAAPSPGPVEIYGRPTALHPWQLYVMLTMFGLIGLAFFLMGLLPLLKKSK
jgi:hypothetical protein